MVLKGIVFLAATMQFFCFNAHGQGGLDAKPVQKRIERLISTTWPGQTLNILRLELEPVPDRAYPVVAILSCNDSMYGYLLINRCKSKYNYFEYALTMDGSGNLKGIEVLTYREDYGGEVCSRSWLRQFIEKASGDHWVYGDDISAISGATISATNLCKSIHSSVVWMKKQKNEGKP